MSTDRGYRDPADPCDPRYPAARIAGTAAAWAKLAAMSALPRGLASFDCDAADAGQLRAANTELARAGVRLVYIAGDVATHTLVAVAHNHLLSGGTSLVSTRS